MRYSDGKIIIDLAQAVFSFAPVEFFQGRGLAPDQPRTPPWGSIRQEFRSLEVRSIDLDGVALRIGPDFRGC
jgi:hypothetical protein